MKTITNHVDWFFVDFADWYTPNSLPVNKIQYNIETISSAVFIYRT